MFSALCRRRCGNHNYIDTIVWYTELLQVVTVLENGSAPPSSLVVDHWIMQYQYFYPPVALL